MTEDRKAWLACFIDSEGSMGLLVTKRLTGNQFKPQVWVCNTDLRMLGRATEILGELGVRSSMHLRKPTPLSRRPLWALGVKGTRQVQRLLDAIQPYLIAKRQKAEVLQEFFAWRQTYPQTGRRGLAGTAEGIVRAYAARMKQEV